MWRGAVRCAPPCFLLIASLLHAQTRASLGVGVGTVRTETGTSFSSASLWPSLRFSSPSLVVRASGFVASLPGGTWAAQGRLNAWATTPRLTGRWRLGAEGIAIRTRYTGGNWTAAAHGVGELLWSSPHWGFAIGAGPSAGWIANNPSVTALHTRARLWLRPSGRGGPTEWQFSAEPTRFFGAWFTDLEADLTVTKLPVVVTFDAESRVSSVYGSTGAGSASLQWYLAPSLSLELSGGSFLREPYQGYPRGRFLSMGLRFGESRLRRSTKLAPFVPLKRGDSLVVQFTFSGVRSVAIAGDWNDWQPSALRQSGPDQWETRFVLKRGTYHFNLLVDGNTWVVPAGVATVPDGQGGMAAVLVVR
jgi:AMP-activated protein kinase-like protein